MNNTMDNELDRLLREATRRRADRVPDLPADFQERVMAKLRETRPVSLSMGGGIMRLRSWRWWAMAVNVAAAVFLGFFLFFEKDVKTAFEIPEPEIATLPTPVSEEAEVPVETKQLTQFPPTPSVRKGVAARPSLTRKEPVPSDIQEAQAAYEELISSIEKMERQALRETDEMMSQALLRQYMAVNPS